MDEADEPLVDLDDEEDEIVAEIPDDVGETIIVKLLARIEYQLTVALHVSD